MRTKEQVLNHQGMVVLRDIDWGRECQFWLLDSKKMPAFLVGFTPADRCGNCGGKVVRVLETSEARVQDN